MVGEQRQYISYLLRLWQERAKLPPVWRASLEDPQTGDLIGFADIRHLLTFLEAQVADGTSADAGAIQAEVLAGDVRRAPSPQE